MAHERTRDFGANSKRSAKLIDARSTESFRFDDFLFVDLRFSKFANREFSFFNFRRLPPLLPGVGWAIRPHEKVFA
jgi:hypothetical protein